jgi:hypothetical protein
MKRTRFTEEQIIAAPREREAAAKTADVGRKHDLLQVEGEVQRDGGVGRPPTEGAGRQERQAEKAAGGSNVG